MESGAADPRPVCVLGATPRDRILELTGGGLRSSGHLTKPVEHAKSGIVLLQVSGTRERDC